MISLFNNWAEQEIRPCLNKHLLYDIEMLHSAFVIPFLKLFFTKSMIAIITMILIYVKPERNSLSIL